MRQSAIEIETTLKRISGAIRTAVMLAMVILLSFSAPMSAHSGMSDHGQHMDHMTLHAAMDHGSHDTHHMNGSEVEEHSDQHAEMGCCFGICAIAVLTGNQEITCSFGAMRLDPTAHVVMSSVNADGLIKPPNL